MAGGLCSKPHPQQKAKKCFNSQKEENMKDNLPTFTSLLRTFYIDDIDRQIDLEKMHKSQSILRNQYNVTQYNQQLERLSVQDVIKKRTSSNKA